MASSGVWYQGQYILAGRTGERFIVRKVRTHTDPKTGTRRSSLDVQRMPKKGTTEQLTLFHDTMEIVT